MADVLVERSASGATQTCARTHGGSGIRRIAIRRARCNFMSRVPGSAFSSGRTQRIHPSLTERLCRGQLLQPATDMSRPR